MKSWRRWGVAFAVVALAAAAAWAVESREEIAKRLWPNDHIASVQKDVDKQKADGLITAKLYEKKKQMLAERAAGTFKPEMLADKNPPPNLLQNAGFEDFNPNTRKNMSRWECWGGWAWPESAEYDNNKEDRADYVHGGKLSARFKCTGAPARVGITQGIPMVEGATDYEFTVWAKGEGENLLNIAYESGARGQFSGKIGPEWQQVKAVGTIDKGAKKFSVYIYIRGGGTIWLDDAKLLPVGVKLED